MIRFHIRFQDHFSTFLNITREDILRYRLLSVVQWSVDFRRSWWDDWHRQRDKSRTFGRNPGSESIRI